MNIQEVGGLCGDWMELSQDRDRWRALVSRVRKVKKKVKTVCVSYSTAALRHIVLLPE